MVKVIPRTRRYQRQAGFTLLWVIFAVALVGVGLSQVSAVWSASARREKNTQLEWVGAQFVQAIRHYRDATPGVIVKTYPNSFDDLLEDRRYPFAMRHLRRMYPNPFTGKSDWIIVPSVKGGIRGVRIELPSESGLLIREFSVDESVLP